MDTQRSGYLQRRQSWELSPALWTSSKMVSPASRRSGRSLPRDAAGLRRLDDPPVSPGRVAITPRNPSSEVGKSFH